MFFKSYGGKSCKKHFIISITFTKNHGKQFIHSHAYVEFVYDLLQIHIWMR